MTEVLESYRRRRKKEGGKGQIKALAEGGLGRRGPWPKPWPKGASADGGLWLKGALAEAFAKAFAEGSLGQWRALAEGGLGLKGALAEGSIC